jgi:hypothetical protein
MEPYGTWHGSYTTRMALNYLRAASPPKCSNGRRIVSWPTSSWKAWREKLYARRSWRRFKAVSPAVPLLGSA